MISNIPTELSIGSFALIGTLSAYIWDSQSRKIKRLEEEYLRCPFPQIKIDIAEIKTDIKWILKNIQK